MTLDPKDIFVPFYSKFDMRDIKLGFKEVKLYPIFYEDLFTDEDISHLNGEDEIAAAQVEKAKAGIIRAKALAIGEAYASLEPAKRLIDYCSRNDYPVFIYNKTFDCVRPGLWQ